MPDPINPGVKPQNTPPPAVGASPTPQTPQTTAPANPASASGGKTPETVPYARFQQVVQDREQLNERVEAMERRLAQNTQPTNGTAKPEVLPDPDTDPLGHMTARLGRVENLLMEQHNRAKMSEGEKLLSQLKQEYPVFNDLDIGADALAVLQSRLNSEESRIRSPARIVRDVAEKYSKFVVNATNGVAGQKAAIAVQTASLTGGTPEVGAVKQEPFKPKSFDEAHKAAKGGWDRLAQKLAGTLQV